MTHRLPHLALPSTLIEPMGYRRYVRLPDFDGLIAGSGAISLTAPLGSCQVQELIDGLRRIVKQLDAATKTTLWEKLQLLEADLPSILKRTPVKNGRR